MTPPSVAPDLARIEGLVDAYRASVEERRRCCGGAGCRPHEATESAARAALLAEFESLTSTLRAVDAKVVEWRERAQRAEAAAYGRAATLVRQEAEREKNQGKATKARRLLSIAHEILALAPNGSNEGGAP